MTIGAFLIARLSSSRLPNKNILPVVGKPLIELLSERVKSSKLISKVIIATSDLESDDPLEELANKIGLLCYRGSLNNVMERITKAAEKFECDTIVEILGDNPLVHSELIDNVIDVYLSKQADYAATLTKEYDVSHSHRKLFSVGLRVQVYSLKVAQRYINFPEYLSNGRHPSAFIFDNPQTFSVKFLEAVDKWSFMNKPDLNFAVNYNKNLELVKKIFEENYTRERNFPLNWVYKQLESNKDLLRLLGGEN